MHTGRSPTRALARTVESRDADVDPAALTAPPPRAANEGAVQKSEVYQDPKAKFQYEEKNGGWRGAGVLR